MRVTGPYARSKGMLSGPLATPETTEAAPVPAATPERVKIAVGQTAPKLLDKKANLAECLRILGTAAENGAKLVVFPECALTGYCFSSLEEAMPVIETVPGPSTERLAAECRSAGVYAVVGLLERDGTQCYNTTVLVGPEGIIGEYRKTHLPFVGIDRFVAPGNLEYAVYPTAVGKIGMVICYDLQFPECVRVLALKGAEVIVHPTNLVAGAAEAYADFLVRARACENHIYLVMADRVGEERGFKFVGRSQIVSVTGRLLIEGSPDREEILYATVGPSKARNKRFVGIPGQLEADLWEDRRPELYGDIVAPRTAVPLATPGVRTPQSES